MRKLVSVSAVHVVTFSVLLIALALYDHKSDIAANDIFIKSPPVAANIEGTVTNEEGTLLANVNVLIKGTQRSTVTSGSGRFSISVNAGEEATLVFSLTGYQAQQVQLGTKTTVDVMLKAESNHLK